MNYSYIPKEIDQDYHLLRAINVALTKYVWSVAVALGIPGNILTILVANREHNRKLSPCTFMKAMAVTDTLFLLEVAWYYSVFYQGHLDSSADKETRGLIIKLHMFIMHASATISGLYLSAMSIDRLIAVRFPMAAMRLCTTKRAKVAVLGITLPIIAINCQSFFIVRYVEDLESGVRVLVYDVPAWAEKVPSLVNAILGTVLPFSIILGCNVIIIITTKRAAKQRSKLGKSGGTKVKQDKDQGRLTAMLLFVSLAYVVTTLPFRLYIPVMEMPEVKAMYDMSTQYWKLRYTTVVFATSNLWFYNYAVNFYMYCIGGGKRYRDDTKAVIGQILSCCIRK